MFGTQYRVSRDSCYTFMWAVEARRWWWPFWTEEVGMINSREEAISVIAELRTVR